MEELCGTCKHFRCHYIKFGRSYRLILDGHCVYPRLKRWTSDAKACEHWYKKASL